jgi:Arc/MetJ-type ribon-helix-helix transcriptional regulator
MVTTVTVNLSNEAAEALDRAVSEGRFRDRSEALAEAVRALLLQEARAKQAEALCRSYEEHPEDPRPGEIGLRLLAARLGREPGV